MGQKLLHFILFLLLANIGAMAQVDSVNMTGFWGNATNQGIELAWTTDGECNVLYFKIERSLDAINFETVKNIKPLNRNGVKEYSYKDNNIFREHVYYRITTQLSSWTEASKIVAVVRNSQLDLPDVMIYPTITSQYVNVVKNSSDDLSGAYIRIFNLSGHLLVDKPVGGDFLVETLDVSEYSAGAYVIELYKDKLATKAKFIKQY